MIGRTRVVATAVALGAASAAAWAQALDGQYGYDAGAAPATPEQIIEDLQPAGTPSFSGPIEAQQEPVYPGTTIPLSNPDHGRPAIAADRTAGPDPLRDATAYAPQPSAYAPAASDTYAQPQPDYAAPATPAYGYETAPASSSGGGWLGGNWYVKLGGAGLYRPDFEGADSSSFAFQPIISVGRGAESARFTSRNDNISLGVIDTGTFRVGATGKFVFGRDGGVHEDIEGLSKVKFGGEAGGFAEVYVGDFARLRGEVRKGIRSHDGIVADVAADAYFDVLPQVQLSGGPRASWASQGYYDAYYGVDADEAAASGLSEYDPGSGIRSVGVGGAVTWKATDALTTSAFAEYSRLMGPAAGSSLVRERGSKNQLTLGVSGVYRFDLF